MRARMASYPVALHYYAPVSVVRLVPLEGPVLPIGRLEENYWNEIVCYQVRQETAIYVRQRVRRH
jgi:hypothetical protein